MDHEAGVGGTRAAGQLNGMHTSVQNTPPIKESVALKISNILIYVLLSDLECLGMLRPVLLVFVCPSSAVRKAPATGTQLSHSCIRYQPQAHNYRCPTSVPLIWFTPDTFGVIGSSTVYFTSVYLLQSLIICSLSKFLFSFQFGSARPSCLDLAPPSPAPPFVEGMRRS